MKVKVFDEMHEKDLETSVNNFLEEIKNNFVDVRYQLAIAMYQEEQIYCFTAMIIYKSKKEE